MRPVIARITRKVIRLPDGQYAWSVAARTRLIASGIAPDRAAAMAAAHQAALAAWAAMQPLAVAP